MPFLLLVLLLIGAAAFFLVKAPRAGQNASVGMRMASWFTRVILFLAVGLALFLVILLPLPNKQRLLLLVPAFFIGSVLYKTLGAARRKAQKPEPDLERMKRARPGK
jgi:hypothetical protein